MDKTTKYFLLSGELEGYSYIALFFVAMPLKYFADIPEPVRFVGIIHGILAILFTVMVLMMYSRKKLSLKNAVFAFLLSLIPFGTFFLRSLLKKNS